MFDRGVKLAIENGADPLAIISNATDSLLKNSDIVALILRVLLPIQPIVKKEVFF